MRKSLWLLVMASCMPVNSEVATFYDSHRQARSKRCDDAVAGGGDWCQAINGACYPVRVAPDQAPVEGTTKVRYGRSSMCLTAPVDEQCYQDYQLLLTPIGDNFTGALTRSSYACALRPLCRGPADCAEPKYGLSYPDSSCETIDQPVCRLQRSAMCDYDSECVDRHGDGSVCIQNYCESTNQATIDACDANELFGRRCGGGTVLSEASHDYESAGLDPPAYFDDLLEHCGDEMEERLCPPRVGQNGVCMEEFGYYCMPFAGDANCPAGWFRKQLTERLVGRINLAQDERSVCVPMIPCQSLSVTSGDTSGDAKGWCDSPEGEGLRACPDNVHVQAVSNVEACESDGNCPSGSSCFVDLCVITEPSNPPSFNSVSIPVCNTN